MKATLKRTVAREDGIFSEFYFEGETQPALYTLEHAYQLDDHEWFPKIPRGVYTCVRGTHALSNGIPFETFEILGVEGHSGLLFHPGNYENDSHGCILCGEEIETTSSQWYITKSRDAFKQFMERLTGIDTFELEVI